MSSTLPLLSVDDESTQFNFDKIALAVGNSPVANLGLTVNAPTVATLPTTGLYDGLEVYYLADSTNGVVWHLKYRSGSASTYKWEFVGGTPLAIGPYDTVDVAATGGVFNAPTGTQAITTPRAGDYMIAFGHASWHTAANGQVDTGIGIAGGQPAGTQQLAMSSLVTAGTSQSAVHFEGRYNGIAASATIEQKIRTGTSTAKPRNLWVNMRPVRVI